MKTDSLLHRFFREFTGAFFTLLEEEERKAEHYEFTAIEVKEQAFRFDGIFKREQILKVGKDFYTPIRR